ncbi:MAG: pilus assembly protein TadG-related protein [Candidatus Velamenicoccus archaeovorus]
MSDANRIRDERGLVGKIMILWLALLAIFAVAAWDAGSVMITRFKLQNAAESAAFEAAATYKTTQSVEEARTTAEAEVRQDDEGARIVRFKVDPTSGEVTISLAKRASTILAGRFDFLRKLTKATASDTSGPPTL